MITRYNHQNSGSIDNLEREQDRRANIEALWAEYLKERKPTTQRTYQNCLNALARFIQREGNTETIGYIASLDVASANTLALSWKNNLSETLAPATVNVHLCTLKSLCRFLRLTGFIAWDVEIRQRKVIPYRDTRGPSLEEIQKAIAFIRQEHSKGGGKLGHAWQAVQLETLVVLLFSLGLRRNEICMLTLGDIETGAIWIQGKGREEKQRVSLPTNAQKALLRWIQERSLIVPFTHDQHATKSLFLNPTGTPLHPANLYHQIRQLGKWIGATLKPHGFRHAAITQAFERAKSNPSIGIAEIQRFSRHAKAETLFRYRDAQQDDALLVADALDAILQPTKQE